MKEKKKIGFVYYDDIHHIHHFITSFVELYNNKNYIVEIITYKLEHTYLKKILKLYNITEKVIITTETYCYRKILNKLKKRKYPSPIFLIRKNKNLLLKYDVLVFNDAIHKNLLKSRKNKYPKFAFLDHGAGDGNYIYNEKIINFDLVTVAGKKTLNFCKSNADFSNTNIKVCGYQKFESTNRFYKKEKLFNNEKPIIIYNPHFKRELSSFYNVGYNVLDFFLKNTNYNLIFAPHINLFNKKGYLKKENFPKKYFKAENIYIDFGSEKSVDMTYILNAAIYLGDVSSQVYEFISKPRPCIFINSYNINWKTNKFYSNWKLGKVITNINELEEVLKSTVDWSNEYIKKQQKTLLDTFAIDKKSKPSKQIANEIIKLLN